MFKFVTKYVYAIVRNTLNVLRTLKNKVLPKQNLPSKAILSVITGKALEGIDHILIPVAETEL